MILEDRIRGLLRTWKFHSYMRSVQLAGSHAKGTALRDSDFDFFLTLSAVTPGTLAAMQSSLFEHCSAYLPLRRNVSVRILLDGRYVDLVPARGSILWQARFNTWIKTDIAEQIRYVRESGFIDEILALKIWRRRHALRFPSFLIELAVIHARPKTFRALLQFLATDFLTARLIDPGNSNNVVSGLLTIEEKLRIAQAAVASMKYGDSIDQAGC